MDHALTLFGSAFAGFFAIMNPIANTPIFLGLTEEMDEATTRSVAIRSILIAFLIVASFCVAGNFLLHLFGITLSSFRIAGGLLVALVGYHLLQGGHSPVQKSKEIDVEQLRRAMSMAVSPLGMPSVACRAPDDCHRYEFRWRRLAGSGSASFSRVHRDLLLTYFCFIRRPRDDALSRQAW